MTIESFNFAEAVLHDFSFLCENGFSVTEQNETRIGYRSERYEIFVYHGRRSGEIGLEFLPLARTPFGAVSLETLVAVFNKNAADKFPDQVRVNSGEALKARVGFLARTFRDHVQFEALEALDFWDKVIAEGNERFRQRYPTITPSELHKRFITMWEKKDYVQLLRVFSVLESDLSPQEKTMLAYARTEVARSH